MIIENIQSRDDLNLVTDSQDVAEILNDIGRLNAFDSSVHGLFVAHTGDEYSEVYVFTGKVPKLDKQIVRIL